MWFVISLTFAIYLRAGSVIYQKRRQLRNLGGLDSTDSDTQYGIPVSKLTGIQVTSEIACSTPERQSFSAGDARQTRSFTSYSCSRYTVTIEGGSFEAADMLQSSAVSYPIPEPSSRPGPSPLRNEVLLNKVRSAGADSYSQRRSTTTEASSAAWAYTKYAMLFFIALFVTWVCVETHGSELWLL